jgi:hypothetical protein
MGCYTSRAVVTVKGRKVVFDAHFGWENDSVFIQNIPTKHATLHVVANTNEQQRRVNTKFAELLQAFNKQKNHTASQLCDFEFSSITESQRLRWKRHAIVWSLPCEDMPTSQSLQLCGELAHFSYSWSKGKSLACSMAHVVQDDKVFFYDVLFHEQDESCEYYSPYDQHLGTFGIMMFFKKHKCTEWCKDLEKPLLYLGAKDHDFDKQFPSESHRASCYSRSLAPDPLVVMSAQDVVRKCYDGTYYFGGLCNEYHHACRPPPDEDIGQKDSSSWTPPYMLTDNTNLSKETSYYQDGFGNWVVYTTTWCLFAAMS